MVGMSAVGTCATWRVVNTKAAFNPEATIGALRSEADHLTSVRALARRFNNALRHCARKPADFSDTNSAQLGVPWRTSASVSPGGISVMHAGLG
jgi:hypothetical protein